MCVCVCVDFRLILAFINQYNDPQLVVQNHYLLI